MAGIFGDESAYDSIHSTYEIGDWRMWAYQLLYPSSMPEVESGTIEHDDETLRTKLVQEFRVAYQNHVTSLRRENDALRDQIFKLVDQEVEGHRAILEMREIHAALAGAQAMSADQKLALLAKVQRRVASMTAEEIAKRPKPRPVAGPGFADYQRDHGHRAASNPLYGYHEAAVNLGESLSSGFSAVPPLPMNPPYDKIFEDADLGRQLTLAEAAAGVGGVASDVALDMMLEHLAPHYSNGDAADIVAKELLEGAFGDIVRDYMAPPPVKEILDAACKNKVFGNQQGQDWLMALLDALTEQMAASTP